MNRSDFAHLTPLTVQWGDMDSAGHVNNTIFLRYVESGRINYFRDLLDGELYSGDGQGPILADIQCSFLGQLKFPSQIEVGTRTTRLGSKSVDIEAAIFVVGVEQPVATSRAVIVWFDYAGQRSAPLPDAMRARIVAFENVAPTS